MFGLPIREFSGNLEALRDFVQVVEATFDKQRSEEMKRDPDSFLPVLVAMGKARAASDPVPDAVLKRLEEQMLKAFGSTVEIEENTKDAGSKAFQLRTKGKTSERVESAVKAIIKDAQRRDRLYQSSLINLISSVEWFVAKILHEYFKAFPGAIRSEYKFSLSELSAFNSISDARDYLVEKTIENILRDSLENWIRSLKDFQKLTMGYIDAHVARLKEAALRRNVLIHNGGIVNAIYLNSVAAELKPKGLKVGAPISVDPAYLSTLISLFEHCFILVAAEAWKKYKADDTTRGDLLNELAFEHLKAGRYDISEALCRFVMQDSKQSEVSRLNAKYNYWQSIKWTKRFEEIRKDIEAEDCSARERKYVLAKEVLLDDFKAAAKSMKAVLKAGELSRAELQDWPIFASFRQSPEFKDVMDQVSEAGGKPDAKQRGGSPAKKVSRLATKQRRARRTTRAQRTK